jgi:hypothetical protein
MNDRCQGYGWCEGVTKNGRYSPLRTNRFTSHRTASPVMSATAADGSMTCDQKPLPHGISGAQSPKASTIKSMVKIGRVMSNDIPQPHLPPRVPPHRYLPSSIRRYYRANERPLVASTNRPANGKVWSLCDEPHLLAIPARRGWTDRRFSLQSCSGWCWK